MELSPDDEAPESADPDGSGMVSGFRSVAPSDRPKTSASNGPSPMATVLARAELVSDALRARSGRGEGGVRRRSLHHGCPGRGHPRALHALRLGATIQLVAPRSRSHGRHGLGRWPRFPTEGNTNPKSSDSNREPSHPSSHIRKGVFGRLAALFISNVQEGRRARKILDRSSVLRSPQTAALRERKSAEA